MGVYLKKKRKTCRKGDTDAHKKRGQQNRPLVPLSYGNLIKSQSIKLTSDASKPRLIHVGGGYVEAKYVLARKTDSNYRGLRVVTSVSVSVVEDNTSLVLGLIETGELVDHGRGTGTYETGAYKRLENVSLNGGASIAVPANFQTNVIKLVPKVSGTYRLLSFSNIGDPHFRITNATTGADTVPATDDIDGANNRNAMLTINLTAGNVYYLEAFRYNTPYDYTLKMGYNPAASHELTLDNPYSITTSSDSYQMLKFTPPTSGYYTFSTNKTSGYPQLFLFNAVGSLLDSDDDSGGNLNALFEYHLSPWNTYYIAVQGYNGNAAAFSITVTQS